MLHDSIKQSIDQVITVIMTLQSLPAQQLQSLYVDANIGKHVRHVNDHYLALRNGLDCGTLDYNNRNRGTTIETNSLAALNELYDLIDWLDKNQHLYDEESLQKPINVISEIDCLQTTSVVFSSTVARELLYLINHTIHHAAHMSLIMKSKGIMMDQKIGLAPSTRSYLRTSNLS